MENFRMKFDFKSNFADWTFDFFSSIWLAKLRAQKDFLGRKAHLHQRKKKIKIWASQFVSHDLQFGRLQIENFCRRIHSKEGPQLVIVSIWQSRRVDFVEELAKSHSKARSVWCVENVINWKVIESNRKWVLPFWGCLSEEGLKMFLKTNKWLVINYPNNLI